jgi:hypothetical protein
MVASEIMVDLTTCPERKGIASVGQTGLRLVGATQKEETIGQRSGELGAMNFTIGETISRAEICPRSLISGQGRKAHETLFHRACQ